MTNLTNSNTSYKTTQASNQPLSFKVGDIVLCPSLGLGIDLYTLRKSRYKDLLAIHAHGSIFLYDTDGCFIRTDDAKKGDFESLDYAPSLFHNSPANRQAIATLYQCQSDVSVIDITAPDDDEIVKVPSVLLSDTSCEVFNASQVLDDVSSLLYIISNEQLSPHQYKAMARFAYDATSHTSQAQYDLLKRLNEALQHSKFGTVEVSP